MSSAVSLATTSNNRRRDQCGVRLPGRRQSLPANALQELLHCVRARAPRLLEAPVMDGRTRVSSARQSGSVPARASSGRYLARFRSIVARCRQLAGPAPGCQLQHPCVPERGVVRTRRCVRREEAALVRCAQRRPELPFAGPANPDDQKDGTHLPGFSRSPGHRVRDAPCGASRARRRYPARRRRARRATVAGSAPR